MTKVLFFFTFRTRREACNPEAVGSFSGMVGGFFDTRDLLNTSKGNGVFSYPVANI